MNEDFDGINALEPDLIEKIEGQGYVYILYRSDNPSITKIGFTSVSAVSRANNYTDGEWIIHKQYSMPVWLAKLTERAAHRNLQNYWLNPKLTGGTASEIFTCSLDVAENAVELAHLEQLEVVLTSLKLPSSITALVLSQHNFQDKSELGDLVKTISEQENKLKIKISEIQKFYEDSIKLQNVQFKQKTDSLQNQLTSLQTRYKTLEMENKELSAIINSAKNSELKKMIEIELELNKFADKKINPSQFELLRENYRKALQLIEKYRIREYSA